MNTDIKDIGVKITPEKIKSYLSDLEAKKFYGSIVLRFEAGKIGVIRKEETLKEL